MIAFKRRAGAACENFANFSETMHAIDYLARTKFAIASQLNAADAV
ncbi:MAG: hypothetical protein Q8M20_08355 [Rhodocyclaceae bacterium]|nr:hypothetical protein [Rhodocyclaceae bacterium]MDZ4216483.1 hypothetical protein [Rhodocyclaceae bacterium]